MDLHGLTEYITSLCLLIGLPVAIIQLISLKRQTKLTSIQIENQIIINRRNVTFEYINRYSKDLKEINSSIINKLGILKGNDENIQIKELQKLLEDDKIRTDIFSIVSYFENLAIGIEEDYFDNNIAFKSLALVANTTYNALIPYFKLRKFELGRPVAQSFSRLLESWNNVYL